MPKSVSTSRLLSLCLPNAEVQVVATCDAIVLDLQANHYAADGHAQRQYAIAQLSVRDAHRFRKLWDDALGACGDVEDPRQTSLWSNSATTPLGRH